ncbi:MAG: GNAT family N-acetyltransferase [Rubripirellula sp.]|nr:GNAT family N-acetyltransferase [Rubripirellula sp.]
MPVTTQRVDYQNPDDCRDLICMLSEYAKHEMGHDPPELDRLPQRLAGFSTAFSILAYEEGLQRPVGLINCFFGFSTFKSRRLVNIHDVIVTETHRGQGVSAVLLKAVQQVADEHDCCRLTLEVYTDNPSAIRAYRKYGFTRDPEHPDVDVWFLRKTLE